MSLSQRVSPDQLSNPAHGYITAVSVVVCVNGALVGFLLSIYGFDYVAYKSAAEKLKEFASKS